MSVSKFVLCAQHLHHLDTSCVWTGTDAIEIVEASSGGKGTIKFDVEKPSLVFQSSDDQPPIRWFHQKKCADGAFITFGESDTSLHIVEMKSGLRLKEWRKAREQFRGMLLSAIAIKGIIDLSHFDKIICYIAYSRDLLQAASATAPVLRKFQLGSQSPIADIADWLAGHVEIAPGINVPLVKIRRDLNGNANYKIE